MTWLADPSDPLYPVVQIFKLEVHFEVPEPTLIYNYNDGMDLIVVSGDITIAENVTTAIKLGNCRRAATISVAVMKRDKQGGNKMPQIEDCPGMKQHYDVFDSVFLVAE